MITNFQHSIRDSRMMSPVQKASAALRVSRWVARMIGRLAIVHRRMQERALLRRDLERLSDHMARDMGVRREELEAEAAKPFWRP